MAENNSHELQSDHSQLQKSLREKTAVGCRKTETKHRTCVRGVKIHLQ